MIFHFETFLRKVGRFFSRSEQAIRLLRLPQSRGTATVPGIIIIQIDGLSHTQFQRALKKRKMPFVRELIRKEHYHLHVQYSGLPSSTPAVHGELFYGVRGGVPAFSFLNRKTGKLFRMYEPESVAKIEELLKEKGTALLSGGSVYTGIFTGGAEEAHFCPSSLGWGNFARAANPLTLAVLLITNFYSFIRVAILMAIEFFLALRDCVVGLINGHNLFKELQFIPTRVGICILLRELLTIGVKIDIARGLPIIFLNFLGYDEQAHRRGPSSLFAHWALKGIDDAIARIWREARRSNRRSYDLWIFSDHGQEESKPYMDECGRTIEEAVSSVFSNFCNTKVLIPVNDQGGIQLQRIRQLGGKLTQKIFGLKNILATEEQPRGFSMTAMGPMAHVYVPTPLTPDERDLLARSLIHDANVPLVLYQGETGTISAMTKEGKYLLPEDRDKILGPNHPFLADVCRDLIILCQHPDAGDFVLSGWRTGEQPISFPQENGSHCGPGTEETRGFSLLPCDTIFPEKHRSYLRPHDLRSAACHILGKTERRSAPRPVRRPRDEGLVRVMTYNVHSCIGMDGKIDPERIARVIAQYQPDIVALQEVDVGKSRTGDVDQAHRIAQYLQMDFHFSPTIRIEEELYGDAILTHLPMQLIKATALPGLAHRPNLETRGAIWVRIKVGNKEVQCINTHLGLFPKERRIQAKALLSSEWLGHPECQGPVILCGDFNAPPTSPVCQLLQSRLIDVQLGVDDQKPLNTFSGRYPIIRIDHIYVTPDIGVVSCDVPINALTQVTSDHLPLIAEIRIP